MSWLFSQVLVEEYSEGICLDGEQCVPLSGSHTQQAYCALDKMTVFSRLSRFGMTYKPLTANRGEELLTLYQAAFPAKISAQLEKEQELTESAAGCGEKWRASFTKYSPDLRLWKTHQCSLLGDLEPFLETWPQWGLMRDGECWEQRTLAQTTKGTESGLRQQMFPTPVKSESHGSAAFKLTDAVQASLGKTMPKYQQNPQKWEEFQKWPTPTVQDSEQAGGKGCIASSKRGLSLHQATQLWPSPNARDWKDSGASQGNRKFPNLGTQVHWTTPVSDDTSHRTKKYAQGGTPLSMQAGGKLNPTWVEWLMGWPLGWTDLNPLAMDKCHFVPQQLGDS